MTDVDPNRCGEPMNPLKRTFALKGGEEVSEEKEFAIKTMQKIKAELENHVLKGRWG